jgi:hypothetical protein
MYNILLSLLYLKTHSLRLDDGFEFVDKHPLASMAQVSVIDYFKTEKSGFLNFTSQGTPKNSNNS